MKDEVRFPFDVKGFQKAVDQMSTSIFSMENKLNKFGSTMTKSVSKGIMSATAKIGLLIKGFKSIMKNVPEIGQSFKIAGDIMSKEFFFPIRQQIVPYLQKILDWVRDHRALFTKWGQAVADVLKTVIDVGKTLWNTLKSVVEILTNSLQKGLKTSFKTLDEFISVLQVKMAFLTLFIGDAIKAMFEKIAPTFEFIIEKGAEILGFFGDLVSSWLTLNSEGASLQTILNKLWNVIDNIVNIVGDGLSGFFEGLVQPLKNLMTPLDDIMKSFSELLNIFGDDTSGVKGTFGWLGNFVGNTLYIAFEELAWVIRTVVDSIAYLIKMCNILEDVFTGDWDALKQHASELGDIGSNWISYTRKSGSRMLGAMADSVGMGGNEDGVRGIYSKAVRNAVGKTVKIDFGDGKLPYEYGGKMGDWDYWTSDKGIVLPTKDGKKWYRYRYSHEEDNEILNEMKNGNFTRMHDGIISKDGKIVKLDPDDNIYAFKQFKSQTPNITASMNMVFNVTVTEGNAQSVGQQLGYSIHKSFVDRLKEQQMAGGW